MEFDGAEILIGKGAQADVVEYQGYSYKFGRRINETSLVRYHFVPDDDDRSFL